MIDFNKKQVLQSGFHKVIAKRDAFATDFYNELFRLAPVVRQQFPEDMQQQQLKLMDSLIVIIQSLDDDYQLRDYLNSLGKQHNAKYGTQPEHYDLLKKALLTTLAKYLGDDWTPIAEETWTEVIDTIAFHMI